MSVQTRSRLVPGLVSGVLFVAMAATFLNANFGAPTGFPEDESIVHNLGFALFNVDLGAIPSEGFLAAFLIVALTLDVAIDGAIYLAKRDEDVSVLPMVGGGTSEPDSEPTAGGDR